MIIYFTGTGNSRYVAELLGDLLQDDVLNANTYIRERKPVSVKSEKPWVFVFPVYVAAPPVVFMNFLEKSRFKGSKKAYFVAVCASAMSASPYYCHKLAKKMGLEDMGTNQIEMPQNYLLYFKMKGKEDNKAIVEAAKPKVQKLADKVLNVEIFDDPRMKKAEVISTKMVLRPYYKLFIKAKNFYVTDDCIGCGKCESVCPLKNIELKELVKGEGKRPVWGNVCTHCVGCINVCPTEAIQYGRGTIKKPRHYCEKYKPEFIDL